jgi:hypothetical protein
MCIDLTSELRNKFKASFHVEGREEKEIRNAVNRYGTVDVESLLYARYQWITVYHVSL